MDGITNNAYRSICKQIWDNPKNEYNTEYDFYRFTEFMSVEWYSRNPGKLARHLLTSQDSPNTIAQIYGANHENLLSTAIDIDNKYSDSFSWIELNIGCPSPKIMSCEAGAGMLRCRPKTLQIIKNISGSIQKPFSIKTRRWLTDDDRQEQFDFIIESAYYCDMITIHGRSYKQSHSGIVDRDFILKVKEELKKRDLWHIKIIWNGWLKSAEDWLWYMDSIDWIMLGQAAMCYPRSLTNFKPSIEELYEITLKHLHLNLANEYYFANEWNFDSCTNTLKQPTEEELNEIAKWIENWALRNIWEKRFSLIEFRKHLFWYLNGLENNNEFKRQVAQITDYSELLKSIHLFFQTALLWNNW